MDAIAWRIRVVKEALDIHECPARGVAKFDVSSKPLLRKHVGGIGSEPFGSK